MRRLFLSIALLFPITANAYCLTPEEAKSIVPKAEETAFDDIQDLRGIRFISWLKYLSWAGLDPRSNADEVIVFYAKQKGHGADARLVWFEKGCATGKDSLPAEIWLVFINQGKDA